MAPDLLRAGLADFADHCHRILGIHFERSDVERYSAKDTRANVLTGIGAQIVSGVLRTVALVVYAWVYVYVAPFQLPAALGGPPGAPWHGSGVS